MTEPSPLPPPSPTRSAQFSLLGMMLAITVVAVSMAVYFGIGRLMGMSSGEIAAIGLTRFALAAPMLILWTIGLTISLGRQQQQPAYFWATLAFAGFIITTLANSSFSMVLTRMAMTSGSPQSIGLWFSVQGIISVVLNIGCWILMLMALFSRLQRVEPQPTVAAAVTTESPFKV